MRESHSSDPRRSILHHSGKTALQASVFTSADFDVKDRHEFLFRTRDAVKLATAVEFYIEKFMSIMHLYLEGSDSSGTSQELNMGASEMATNNLLGEDDMLALGGEDEDDATAGAELYSGQSNCMSLCDATCFAERLSPASARAM